MMHVIADATFFSHVISGTSNPIQFGFHVDSVTYKTWNDGDRKLQTTVNEFFDINEARTKLQSNLITYYDPYMLTVKAALDTYYPSSGFKSANWLLKCNPTLLDHKFWEDVEGTWTGYSQELTWTHSMRPEVLTHSYNCTLYFDTIEHNLNMAIYCCALALNYVLDHGGFTDCECSGENPPPETNPDGGEKVADKESAAVPVDEFAVLFFFSFAGLASTAFALSMLAALKALEKYLIPIPQP